MLAADRVPAAVITEKPLSYGDGLPSPQGRASPGTVQISSSRHRRARLCRPDLRKAYAFRPPAAPSFASAQAGRLSLSACAEGVAQDARPSERCSLSTSQAAEPQLMSAELSLTWTGPGQAQPLQRLVLPEPQDHVFFVEVLLPDFERGPFKSEAFKAQRAIERFRGDLAGGYG